MVEKRNSVLGSELNGSELAGSELNFYPLHGIRFLIFAQAWQALCIVYALILINLFNWNWTHNNCTLQASTKAKENDLSIKINVKQQIKLNFKRKASFKISELGSHFRHSIHYLI
jgi:hypothetical protein